ncbi:hypothetical protein [Roseateles sp.]|uniref:helix-turn-helix transcriptional regulator n=1 Tax=Roseateles sp. TaxID=1971397 RepID=UPI003266086E
MKSTTTTAARGNDHNPQPLQVLQLEDALLRIKTFAQAAGLSTSTVNRKIAAGELAVVKMGKRCTRIRSSEARRFIQAQGNT